MLHIEHSYIGYDTIGASTDVIAGGADKTIVKTFTLAEDAFVASIDVYCKGNGSNAQTVYGAILDDASGSPGNIIAALGGETYGSTKISSTVLNTTARWLSIPIAKWLPAGTYWFKVYAGNGLTLYYDSGSDKTATGGASWIYDTSQDNSFSNSSRSYSIRGSVLADDGSIDKKISDLTAATAVGPTNQFVINAGGTSKRITADALGLVTGWIADTATWTYVSASSFKLTGVDATAQFNKGTRIRLKQGGSYKYFVVTGATFSTDTTVTITAGISYTLANAAITDNYYSYAANPQGWPVWFGFTPTWEGSGGNPAIGNGSNDGKFMYTAGVVTFSVVIVMGSTTTYGSGFYLIGHAPVNRQDYVDLIGTGNLYDSNPGASYATTLVGDTSNRFVLRDTRNTNLMGATTPVTIATGDNINVAGSYLAS